MGHVIGHEKGHVLGHAMGHCQGRGLSVVRCEKPGLPTRECQYKHPRHDTDIEQFANDLAGRWKQGDGIEPWLRTVEPELSRKGRSERWSRESLARALNVAGIQYRTSRPWTGVSLLQKITSVRYEDRKRARRKSADARGTSTWEPPAPISIPPAGTEFAFPDGELVF